MFFSKIISAMRDFSAGEEFKIAGNSANTIIGGGQDKG